MHGASSEPGPDPTGRWNGRLAPNGIGTRCQRHRTRPRSQREARMPPRRDRLGSACRCDAVALPEEALTAGSATRHRARQRHDRRAAEAGDSEAEDRAGGGQQRADSDR